MNTRISFFAELTITSYVMAAWRGFFCQVEKFNVLMKKLLYILRLLYSIIVRSVILGSSARLCLL